jgi:hypothetical protein
LFAAEKLAVTVERSVDRERHVETGKFGFVETYGLHRGSFQLVCDWVDGLSALALLHSREVLRSDLLLGDLYPVGYVLGRPLKLRFAASEMKSRVSRRSQPASWGGWGREKE